jgi:hypothetical protein
VDVSSSKYFSSFLKEIFFVVNLTRYKSDKRNTGGEKYFFVNHIFYFGLRTFMLGVGNLIFFEIVIF